MPTSMKASRLITVLVLAGLPAILLWRALFLGEVFAPAHLLKDLAPWRTDWNHVPVPWNVLQWDGMAEFYPWRAFAAQSLRSGYLPLWNPHEFCGTPFLANGQSGIFYPLNALFVILPVSTAFGVSAWLHLSLTGLFTYSFLRRGLNCSRSGALTGGIVWQLSNWQVSWLALPTFLSVSTWIPLALLAVVFTVRKPSAARAGLLGACLGMMLLAGHFQIALYGLLLTTGYALFCILSRKAPVDGGDAAEPALDSRDTTEPALDSGDAPQPRVWRTRIAGAAVLAVAVTLLIGLAQLLPSVELSRMSHRANATVNWDSYQGYLKLAPPAFHLLTLLQPDFFGNPTNGTYWGFTNYAENACYVGILGLLLAVAGMLAWRSNPQSRFFTIAALLALLTAIGTPINALLYFGIPGFSSTGSPARILVLWSFCAAVLAAIGFDRLRSPDPKQAVRAFGAALAVAALLGAAAGAHMAAWFSQNAPPGALAAALGQQANLWRIPAALLLLGFLALGAYARGSISHRAITVVFPALVAVDLLLAGIGYNPTSPVSDVYPVTPAIAFLQQHAREGRVMPVNTRWSIDPMHPPPAVLPPNASTYYGLYDLQGYDSLFPGQYMAFAARLNGDGKTPAPQENGNMVFTRGFGSDTARSAGARYVVALGGLPFVPEGFNQVVTDGPVIVYEDTKALSRVTGPTNEALEWSEDGPSRIRVMTRGGNAIVVRDQWYPGWHASVNGKALTVDAGPDIFRTVKLPADAQKPAQVDLTFAPASVQIGVYSLCAAMAVISAIFASAVVLRRSRYLG